MKNSYKNTKLILEKIQYEKHNWNTCGDLKVTALLLGYRFVTSCVGGIVGTENIITSKNRGLNKKHLF